MSDREHRRLCRGTHPRWRFSNDRRCTFSSDHWRLHNSPCTAAARSATITGVYTAATIAGTIKAKDELSLEYKLDSVETSKTVLSNTAKAKAKSDGEDILTPIVETSAQAIISAVTKR